MEKVCSFEIYFSRGHEYSNVPRLTIRILMQELMVVLL